jgi:UDP-N-acetylmuramoylalanine--D-glutamate ligase
MIESPAFAGKRYAVLGLARSGLATLKALVASGARVTAWDDRAQARAQVAGQADVADPMAIDLAGFDAVVVSPGVPLNSHPLAARARAAGVPVIGDIELFAQARAALPPHKVVAVTGTNGKSTTTALIHHIAAVAGPALLGGNIGLPILGEAPLPPGGVYVLELSSFQIDLTHSLDADVAVLLNLSPDHLDRHGDMGGYAAAKARLFAMQRPSDIAVIATDDEHVRAIARTARARIVEVSGSRMLQAGIAVVGGKAWIEGEAVASQADWPALQGPHNAQNAAAAIATALALGIDRQTILEGLRSYPGLPHRMERVAERRGVLFVNDSKATNPTSTAPALAAYPTIHWILGGLAKTDELDACLPHLGHVRAAYVIGEAAPLFRRLLDGKVPVVDAGTIEKAVEKAAAAAVPGETVLLSPACASYDQFRDYEARGAAFRNAVEGLGR